MNNISAHAGAMVPERLPGVHPPSSGTNLGPWGACGDGAVNRMNPTDSDESSSLEKRYHSPAESSMI